MTESTEEQKSRTEARSDPPPTSTYSTSSGGKSRRRFSNRLASSRSSSSMANPSSADAGTTRYSTYKSGPSTSTTTTTRKYQSYGTLPSKGTVYSSSLNRDVKQPASPVYNENTNYETRGSRSFFIIGALLAIGMAIVWLSGFTGVEGPKIFPLDTSVFLFGVGLFLTALTLVYVLWSFPKMVKHSESRMNARMNQHVSAGHPLTYVRAPQPVMSKEMVSVKQESLAKQELPAIELPAAPVRRVRSKPKMLKVRRRRAYARTRRPRRTISGRPVIDIEGIGPKFADRLNDQGIVTIGDLRKAFAEDVAPKVKAPVTTMQSWQSMGDLMEVDGIGPQFAELLVRSGITSVTQLANMEPAQVKRMCDTTQSHLKVAIQKEKITPALCRTWVQNASRLRGGAANGGRGVMMASRSH